MIPYLFLIALAVGLVMWFIYNMTPHGKIYVCDRRQRAVRRGFRCKHKEDKDHHLHDSGSSYALGGFLVGAKSGGSSVNMGYGWELEAIAACTIGGVSVNGGIGRISGVLIGVLVFEILKTCLQYLGVDTNYQYIAQGYRYRSCDCTRYQKVHCKEVIKKLLSGSLRERAADEFEARSLLRE